MSAVLELLLADAPMNAGTPPTASPSSIAASSPPE